MISIIEKSNGDIEISLLNRSEFKDRISKHSDKQEIMSDIIQEEGYFSYNVEEGLNKGQLSIDHFGTIFAFKEKNKDFVKEILKYNFIILNNV